MAYVPIGFNLSLQHYILCDINLIRKAFGRMSAIRAHFGNQKLITVKTLLR